METVALNWPWAGTKRAGTQASEAARRLTSWPAIALAAIVLLAGALRLFNLSALGSVNTYYTAAVTAILKSWHNFFFAAAEPGGAVNVEKLPVGFWLQAIPAFIFGVNTFGVLLPQLLAGMASVVVLYHLMQRKFGLVAGLALAPSTASARFSALRCYRIHHEDGSLHILWLLALLENARRWPRKTEDRGPARACAGQTDVGTPSRRRGRQSRRPGPCPACLPSRPCRRLPGGRQVARQVRAVHPCGHIA